MSNVISKKYQIEEQRISRALMSPFVVLTIQYFILVFLNLMGTSMGARVQVFSKVIVGVIHLYSLPIVFKRSHTRFFTVYLCASVIFMIHYVVFPENQVQMQLIFIDIFLMSMPAFIYSMSIGNFHVLQKTMIDSANIVFLFGTLTAFYVFTGRASVGTYSISLSYYMLLPAIIHCNCLIDRFNFRSLLIFVGSLGIILALGARGPLMCLGVFILLKMMRPNARWTKLRVVGFGGSVFGLAVSLFFFNEIIIVLYNIFNSLGINSRTLRLFMLDSVHLSGREQLYKLVIPEIIDRPLFGIGIAGDYRIIGTYVHNFFIEVLGNFGVFAGGVLIIILVILVLRLLFRCNMQVYGLVSMWFCYGFIHLMVSSSYLVDIKFWIFLGLVINLSLGTGRRQQKNESECLATS